MMDCLEILDNWTYGRSKSVGSGCQESIDNGKSWSLSSFSCQTCSNVTSNTRRDPLGRFMLTKEQSLPSHQSEQEEARKQFQFQWPKFWEWPPACTTDWDVCSSVPSDTGVDASPSGLCVTLEPPVPKKRTFAPSKDFFASPPSIVFKRHESGVWDEFAWIRIQNRGVTTRRLSLVPPFNKSFTVVWAATLKENNTVPPGLHRHILVQFTPRSEQEITDELTIRVEGDGAIVIPISTQLQDPPLLDIDDFSLGCCFVGDTFVRSFRIRNDGGIGRFWLLPESEFMNERFGVPPAPVEEEPETLCEKPEIEELGEEIPGEEELQANVEVEATNISPAELTSDQTNEEATNSDEVALDLDETKQDTVGPSATEGRCAAAGAGDAAGEDYSDDGNPPPNTPAEAKKAIKPGQLDIPPFRLSPTCFSLLGGQEIKVTVRFSPLEAKFFHERICFLCDNGEVRWIILKGLGIEAKRHKLFTIQGDGWTCDGPKMTLDLGDMCAEEPMKQNLKISNSSCTPVYFRWIHHSATSKPLSAAELYDQSKVQLGKKSVLEAEFEGEDTPEVEVIPGIPLMISPEQGFLKGCAEVNCSLDIVCPTLLGSYSSRLCLHVSQFSQASLAALEKMSDREVQHEIQRQLKIQKQPPKVNPFMISAYFEPPPLEIPPITADPTTELSIWLRSVLLQCFFDPPILKCTGMAFTQVKKRLIFYNSTKYPIKLSMGGLESETVNMKVAPENMNVPPQSEVCFKVTLRFQKPGELRQDLTGVLEMPFKTVHVFLATQITTDPPVLCQDLVEIEQNAAEVEQNQVETEAEHTGSEEKIEEPELPAEKAEIPEYFGEDVGEEAELTAIILKNEN